MTQPTEKPNPAVDDSQDSTAIMFHPQAEAEWERRQNTFLEAHPFLCGYVFLSFLVVLVFATHLISFAVSLLFLYLASDFLTNDVRRYVKFLPKALLFSILYIVMLSVLTVLIWKVIPDTVRRLPALAQNVQTEVTRQFEAASQRWDLNLYIDPEEVNKTVMSVSTAVVPRVYSWFSRFSKGFVYFIFACAINLLLYHNIAKIDAVFSRRSGSLMTFLYQFSLSRARIFYFYFKRVMGGQIIISLINTAISAIVIFGLGLPQPVLLMVTVFTCGLFPIIGNLASNTILTLTALVNVGLFGAAVCLGLLVGIHKLEYFLNSKIIGDIVHLPMVITLLSLIVCEVLLGLVGLILAVPLVLYLRHELEFIPGLSRTEAIKDAIKS